jgi:ABC-type dipeptide/oligopeptide/nickel transport system permease component
MTALFFALAASLVMAAIGCVVGMSRYREHWLADAIGELLILGAAIPVWALYFILWVGKF